jgi:sugar-phosphatase
MTATTGPRPAPARDVLGEVYDAVLFDMDGTLISSTRSVERCWLRFAAEFGAPTEDLAPFRFHGVPGRDIVDLLALQAELEDLLTVPVDVVSAGSSGAVAERARAESVAL